MKLTPSDNKSSGLASKTDRLTTRPSGMIYAPSGVNSLEDWLTRLSLAFHAPPSLLPASKGESLTPATSGLRSSGLLPSADQQWSFWKTSPLSSTTHTMKSCPAYRRWATGVRRPLSRPPPRWAQVILESGSSYLPTKTAGDFRHRSGERSSELGLEQQVKASFLPTVTAAMTPYQRDGMKKDGKKRYSVEELVKQAQGYIPTMTARDGRTLAGSRPLRRAEASGLPLAFTIGQEGLRQGVVPSLRSLRLLPEWVEAFMGFEEGWTDVSWPNG